MEILKKYMELNNITGYQVAKKNDVSQPTIDRAASKDLDNLSFKNIRAIANTLNKSVAEVAGELDKMDKRYVEMEEEAMMEVNELVGLINEKQAVSRDAEYSVYDVLDFEEYTKLNGSKMAENTIVDIEAMNYIDEDSQYILVVSTPEFYEDENEVVHESYKAVDLKGNNAYNSIKEFITDNAYRYLLELIQAVDFDDSFEEEFTD
ncbi:hypothetical protein REH36_05690 [Pediococcus pentosaceus]|uniref:hypothetical protein n=1 Tax=Pediococcus pentosaceus TaxID=1255 RepID=UPI002B4BDE61|nr:hypothetical protein [Pediococcus pentosaceus]MEB3377423.1 hypothetical protein [Pediococcus pentosaceus]